MAITYYNSKHDISYSKFNVSNIPWNINTSYIYQNNLNTRNVSQYFQNINNNLIFESSDNNIIFIAPQNKNVIVKNDMVINNNLDISKSLNTSLTRTNDISVNNILHFLLNNNRPNIVGDLKVQGNIIIKRSKFDPAASKTRFTNIVLSVKVLISDCSIVNCDIVTADISNVSIINSYIYNTPIGYDKYNNISPTNAIFSDVILNNLIFDNSLNRLSYIKFNNNTNTNSISISNSNDYSKLQISKPLLVEQQETNTNIINVSNISIFNGDISCNTLYYSYLNPDIRLDKYFDISIGSVSLSGSIIPSIPSNFNLGSANYTFNNVYSNNFIGFLDGSCAIAINLVKNLDMSFRNLDITGIITLSGQSLNQNLTTNFVTISGVNISFGNITRDISDLSLNINSNISTLRTNFNISFGIVTTRINSLCGDIITISNNIFYTKTSFDTCLNRNVIKKTDLSTAIMENPNEIYKTIGYVDSTLNKQINVTLSNELVFPYAITYIDDIDEDTNIKEDYKIKQTKYKSTTTTTTAYTVTTTRTFKTTTHPNTTTIPAEPDNINNNYLVMDYITSSDNTIKRKWYDSNGSQQLPAVFKKTVAAVNATTVTTFELNTDQKTWDQHKTHTANTLTSGNVTYSLAVITNDTDNTTIKNLLPSNSAAWIGAQRKKYFSYIDLATGGSVTNDGTYIYHTFTSSGTFTPKFNGDIQVLLVGGGGGGGSARGYVSGVELFKTGAGGGGGGGGVVRLTKVTVSNGVPYDIGVGAGGPPGTNGTSSTAFGATAAGGGRGGGPGTSDVFQTLVAGWKGENGGSGGGAGYPGLDSGSSFSGGSGNVTNIIGSSNTGNLYWGNGAPTYYPWGYNRASGGGGAGGHAPTIMGPVATNASAYLGYFGAGGLGMNIPFLPSRSVWGGGGGGGTIKSGWQGGSVDPDGGGGQGGGGISTNSNGNGGGNGIANSGGGGGGGGGGAIYSDKPAGLGGAGGSGIVIIRYTQEVGGWPGRGSSYWKWVNNATWDFTRWATAEPGLNEDYVKIQTDGNWHDVDDHPYQAIYMRKEFFPQVAEQTSYICDNALRTWSDHYDWGFRNSYNGIIFELASITDSTENDAIAAAAGNNSKIYIGGRRKLGSSATGKTSNDWEWVDGTTWSNTYNNFYAGYSNTTYTYTTTYTQGSVTGSSTTTNLLGEYNVNTPSPPTYDSESDITQTNVKLPLLVSSGNGSIVVTSTANGVDSLPNNRAQDTATSSIAVSGFGPNDADVIGTTIGATVNSRVVNSIELSTYQINTTGANRIGNTNVYSLPNIITDAYPNATTDEYIYKRFLRYQYDTYTYGNSYYSTDNGSQSGTFKISENTNNYSYYKTVTTPTTIGTTYSCVAITNDGTFVALGKAYDVTVYIKASTGWTTLGPINVNFSTYTNNNIIPTQLPENFKKNIQNLAINYIAPRLFLAYGDNKTSIKVYRYTITGHTWAQEGQVYSHDASIIAPQQLSNPTNFGYFVILSSMPSILGFTVDDKFHTYNCSNSNTNSIRGTAKTLRLPTDYSAIRNIIAFKMSSDAEKIIVSNINYVFIYKWNVTDWDEVNYIYFPTITFNYGSSNNITSGPRSLDISNISSNDCVFAVGFPDKLINTMNNNNARGYVEYWKLSNTTLTKITTLFPRIRDTSTVAVDTNAYFFSAGGIKITNSNTILVAPNYKFHFNNTNKNYYCSSDMRTHQGHYNVATLAAIENEVDNEVIRFASRGFPNANTYYYIGGKRVANAVTGTTGPSSWFWWTSNLSLIWNFEAWDTGQPNNDSANGGAVEVMGTLRKWDDVINNQQKYAMYMTMAVQYSLNTFSIFNNRFFFHSSGFYSSYYPIATQSVTIAKWEITSIANIISISADGSVQQSTNTRTTLSDIRLKENIVDTRPKLQDLLKIRVVNYNLKGTSNTKGNKLIGLVAQELEDIFPLLVGKQELSQEDIKLGKTEIYKYVKYSCFDVILIKAIQEQYAIISNLTSQLDVIDNKCKILKTIAQDIVILNQDRNFLMRENELLKISINKILELMKKGAK